MPDIAIPRVSRMRLLPMNGGLPTMKSACGHCVLPGAHVAPIAAPGPFLSGTGSPVTGWGLKPRPSQRVSGAPLAGGQLFARPRQHGIAALDCGSHAPPARPRRRCPGCECATAATSQSTQHQLGQGGGALFSLADAAQLLQATVSAPKSERILVSPRR